MKPFILGNMTLFDGHTWQTDCALILENDCILDVVDAATVSGQITHDLQGHMVAPGFVDVQVNGGGGVMFNDARTVDDLDRICKAHQQYGSTTLLPTLMSDRFDRMQRGAALLEEAIKQGISGVRGMHFEGPYLNNRKRGVHAAKMIRAVDPDFFQVIEQHAIGRVMLTVAPERVSEEEIKRFISLGMIVSAGHTAATYDQAMAGFMAGISGVTHLFNAMSPFESRSPGVVGAALDHLPAFCGIIADGYHVHPASLRIALAAKKTDRMALVTDAMSPVGTDASEFKLYGQKIRVRQGRCATEDGTLAGSNLNMMSAVRYAHQVLGVSLAQALRMASFVPARWIGLDQTIGTLEAGKEADLVVFDQNFSVKQTWIKARPVYVTP